MCFSCACMYVVIQLHLHVYLRRHTVYKWLFLRALNFAEGNLKGFSQNILYPNRKSYKIISTILK